MAIRKTLTPYGSSLALVIDRPILDLLGISRDTALDLTTDGARLVITPVMNVQPRPNPPAASPAEATAELPVPPSWSAGVPGPGLPPPLSQTSRASATQEAPAPGGVVRAASWMGNYAPARLIHGTHRIRLLVDSNPKREGSASRLRFDRYRDNMTVDEAYAAGIRAEDVRWDLAHGFIELY